MKRILLIVALIATVYTQAGFAQSIQAPSLLTSYYDIKNALVNSDAALAAAKAVEFSKVLSSIDMKSISSSDMGNVMDLQHKLDADAKEISQSKNIAAQREHFAGFSVNLFKLAKIIKLTSETVYYNYCPMKKSYWISDNAVIKNPYFGKGMLTCGSVKETLN